MVVKTKKYSFLHFWIQLPSSKNILKIVAESFDYNFDGHQILSTFLQNLVCIEILVQNFNQNFRKIFRGS